jgi:hypothetical protein
MINQIIVNEFPHIKSDIAFINEIELADIQTQIDNIIIPPDLTEDIENINIKLDSFEEDISDIQTLLDNLSIPDYLNQINNIIIPDYSDLQAQITNINNNINIITNILNNISASDIYFDNNNKSSSLGALSGVNDTCLGNNGITMYGQVIFSSIIEGLNVSDISGYVTSITLSLISDKNQGDFNGILIISTESVDENNNYIETDCIIIPNLFIPLYYTYTNSMINLKIEIGDTVFIES